jgi:sigma-B regulation protein RsbU (phosphoserine phosphatase)
LLIILYIDGVTEAFNDAKELYTQERLEKLLVAYDIQSNENVVSVVINHVSEFEGDSEQSDDITVLAIKRFLS